MTGEALKRFGKGLLAAANDPKAENDSEFSYYPDEFFEPYKSRRRKVGWDLYGLLGIKKGDFEKTKAQHDRNLIFFDAPVGMIFTIHRDLKIGSWLDFGMFLQNVMVLARSHGLETCPQAAFSHFHKTIREFIPVGDENIVVCGMAMGIRGLVTARKCLDTGPGTTRELYFFCELIKKVPRRAPFLKELLHFQLAAVTALFAMVTTRLAR